MLASWYSGLLNGWGASLQRNGRWTEAAPCFALARDLNPNNLPAGVNLLCNSNLLARQTLTVVRTQPFEEQFGASRNWNQVLTENGPFDEPSYCYQLGLGFARGGMLRQAGQEFERVRVLAPGDLTARLVLGDLFNRCLMPDRALQVAAEIRADAVSRPFGPTNEVEVAFLEASAWYVRTNHSRADGIIYSLLAAHPGDAGLLNRAGAAFAAHQSYSNALRVVRQQLQSAPDNVGSLINLGNLCAAIGDFSNSIPPFTRALSLTNISPIRFARAFAYFRTGQLDAAEADYQELLRASPDAYPAYNGLGEIALQKRDTNAAIRFYQQFLAEAPAEGGDARSVAARLRSLQPGPH
jgi:tetratricopeptide (TPR) repeat protein